MDSAPHPYLSKGVGLSIKWPDMGRVMGRALSVWAALGTLPLSIFRGGCQGIVRMKG